MSRNGVNPAVTWSPNRVLKRSTLDVFQPALPWRSMDQALAAWSMGGLFLCRPGSLPKKIFQQPAKARLTYYSLSTTSSISLTSRSAKPVAGPLPALGSAEYPLERYGIRMQL